MKKNILITVLAVLLGLAGMFLRTRQLTAGYEDAGGGQLLLHASPEWTILLILCGAAAVVLFLLAFRLKGGDDVPAIRGNALGLALSCVGLVPLLAFCVYALLQYGSTGDILKNLVFPLFGLVTAYCTVVFSAGLFKGREPKRLSAAGSIPVFFCCLWLIICYRDNAIEPEVTLFVFELAAIILTLVSFCCTVNRAVYGRNGKASLAFSALALTVLLVTLADAHPGLEVLLFLYAAVEMVCTCLLARTGSEPESQE